MTSKTWSMDNELQNTFQYKIIQLEKKIKDLEKIIEELNGDKRKAGGV